MSRKHNKKKRIEWSKVFASVIALCFGIYGIWCGIQYYILCRSAIELNAQIPDATLAVACVSTVIASLVSYLLYQAGLKNSRNKYGIGSDGEPFKQKTEDPEEVGMQIESDSSTIKEEEDLR